MHRSLLAAWNAISLRTKITGVTVLVLTFGLLMSGVGTTLLFKPVLIEQLDQQLRAASSMSNINAMLATPSSSGAVTSDDSGSSSYFVALYDEAGKLVQYNWRSDPSSIRPAVKATLSKSLQSICNDAGLFYLSSNDGSQQFRARCVPVHIQTTDQPGVAVVAAPTAQIDGLMASYLTIFLGFGVIVVVVGAILTRMLVTTTFAPLREVERTAAAIADGDYSQRLGGAEPNTEVGRLNRSLNTMLSRIDRAFKDRARTIDQMRRFVGDASHELRTPLVSVRGYAELYRMGALQDDAAVASAMDRIEKEALRMGGLVEDLLELARLDETRPLELAVVDLLPLADDAAMDARAAHPSRRFSVVTDLPPAPLPQPGPSASHDDPTPTAVLPVVEAQTSTGPTRRIGTRVAPRPQSEQNATGPIAFTASALARLRRRGQSRRAEIAMAETMPLTIEDIPEPRTLPALVMGEGNKLRQVLNNLIGNAVRYTPDGTPIEIRVSVDPGARKAGFDVIDHGEGIPPQIRDKIFERFWRADTSRTRETGGSGLGLAIVTSIVSAHHGTVEVVDTPGGGATFRVMLPLAEPGAAAPAGD
ncbi:sensor histidine kinase [Gryllotalpicola ginsengisoli]|uniref:sensor histidine kinase n=1 Tax=Gryllotalpicola ginsengisoli TaxID=444608 RepID=UPI0003B62F02|nr:HAMP domain-containing sensor histidine kinase [Gryllotalpicola ginsengisoli]